MKLTNATLIYQMRKFYSDHLSKIRFFRTLKKKSLPLYLFYRRRTLDITATFTPLSEFCKKQNIKHIQLIAPAIQKTSNLLFFKPDTFNTLSDIEEYLSPDCSAYEINNISVISRTDFLFYEKTLIHDDNYSPLVHISTLDQFNIAKMNEDRKSCKFPLPYPSRKIEKGINLTSGGAGNYAHFMTEVIPRLIAIDRSGLYDDYPLIVDGWIGNALTEILVFFNKKCRQMIALSPFENVLVEKLIHVSAPVFAPQDFLKNTIYNKQALAKTINESGESYLFSSESMNMVRDFAITACSNRKPKANPKKRIYLKRKPVYIEGIQYNSGRRIINDIEVTLILKAHGFKTVDVTTLSFSQQIALFKDAEIIVSPLGAALTNCLFCAPSTKVIGLGAYYEGADYSYHSRMLSSIGMDYSVVLGAQYREQNTNPLHYSFFVCTDSLRAALRTLPTQEPEEAKE